MSGESLCYCLGDAPLPPATSGASAVPRLRPHEDWGLGGWGLGGRVPLTRVWGRHSRAGVRVPRPARPRAVGRPPRDGCGGAGPRSQRPAGEKTLGLGQGQEHMVATC